MLRALAALLLCLAAGSTLAQAPAFEVRSFDVSGGTLLTPAQIDQALAPFRGPGKTFADLTRATEALEDAYQARGYSAVRVSVPEQELRDGVVRLRVVEQRLGRIAVEGNRVFGENNVRRSVPSLREGAPPNTDEIARELQLAAEHPVKQTQVTLRAGAAEDQVDALVRVVDDKAWRGFLTLDNTGTGETGYGRVGLGYQHSNLFDRDHVLTAQYITSPTQPGDVEIYGAGYRVPFYGLHSALDMVAGYSNVNSGVVQGLFAVAGQGTIAGAHWSWYPRHWGALEHKVSAGLDYRAFSNQVTFQNQGVVPDITVHPWSAAYFGVLRDAVSETTFNAGFSRNIPGGNDGTQDDFDRTRAQSTATYQVLRYGFTYLRQVFSTWQARALVNVQYTQDALVPGEQFGVGGPDSVRGYTLREVVNDRGYSGQLELYTPELAGNMHLSDSHKLRAVGFYDFGSVKRNHALPGEQLGDSIASVGIGVRLGIGKPFSARLDFAHLTQSTPGHLEGSLRASGALAYAF